MTKLLNIDGNPKTVKGQKYGYMTGVQYLAPWKASGFNTCAKALLAGCNVGCLNIAGHGGMSKGNATFNPHGVELPDNAVQRARIWRTRLFFTNRKAFEAMLRKELKAFIKRAKRKELIPVFRPNGTSDIDFVTLCNWLFTEFPDLQIYDYTKIANRLYKDLPANYHLSLSYSEANSQYAEECIKTFRDNMANLVAVVRSQVLKDEFIDHYTDKGISVIDGDKTDLRFTDAENSIVLLKAKGKAKKDATGFVLDEPFAV